MKRGRSPEFVGSSSAWVLREKSPTSTCGREESKSRVSPGERLSVLRSPLVGRSRYLCDVEAEELAGTTLFVAYGRDRPAAANLSDHAADVSEARQIGAHGDFGVSAGGDFRRGFERRQPKQLGAPCFEDPRLSSGRGRSHGSSRPSV